MNIKKCINFNETENLCLQITWALQDAGLKEFLERFVKIPAKNFSIF